jgi:hypothetical protein
LQFWNSGGLAEGWMTTACTGEVKQRGLWWVGSARVTLVVRILSKAATMEVIGRVGSDAVGRNGLGEVLSAVDSRCLYM